MKAILLAMAVVSTASHANAASWQYSWTPVPGEPAPRVEISPFKYGKSWAYAVEIDDGPISTLTVSQPLLARFEWNDAPPGVAGGVGKPFVGAAAVVVGSIGRNSAALSFEDLATLKNRGWSIVNHSYWHSGVHWDKSKMNTPEQFRRELFWSQAILGEFVGGGRAPTHFVFPNGDYNYGPYLHEFGLRTGSRTHGSSVRNLFDPKLNLLNYTRNYLDTKPWQEKNNALLGLPQKPQPGDFIIDFTHGMSDDPESVNYRLWTERLHHIAKSWGSQGDNSMWVAPTDVVFDYVLAAREAKVTVTIGKLTVELPDGTPGTALTLKLEGLSGNTKLAVPEGGTLYREGDTVWLTTPVIGNPGVPTPMPRLRRVYVGEVKNLIWNKSVAIAGVRLLNDGKHAQGRIAVDAVTPQGETINIVSMEKAALEKTWGRVLSPVVPDRPAVLAKELRVTADKSLKEMEVWAVESP